MKLLNQAELLGIPLLWALIRCAWEGTNELPRAVTVGEIQDFALAQVECASDSELTRIAALTSEDDSEEISKALYHLAPEISEKAQRAFRLILVHRTLAQLPSDPPPWPYGIDEFLGQSRIPA